MGGWEKDGSEGGEREGSCGRGERKGKGEGEREKEWEGEGRSLPYTNQKNRSRAPDSE